MVWVPSGAREDDPPTGPSAADAWWIFVARREGAARALRGSTRWSPGAHRFFVRPDIELPALGALVPPDLLRSISTPAPAHPGLELPAPRPLAPCGRGLGALLDASEERLVRVVARVRRSPAGAISAEVWPEARGWSPCGGCGQGALGRRLVEALGPL